MSPLFVLNSLNWALFFSKMSCRFFRFQQWLYAFDTEDNWGTQTQLFKQVQTFTDAPEGNTMH